MSLIDYDPVHGQMDGDPRHQITLSRAPFLIRLPFRQIVTRNSSLQLKTSKTLPEQQKKEQRNTRSKRASVKQ